MSLTTIKRCLFLRHLWILLAMPLAVAAGTARIYVANTAGTTVDVIDPATNKVVQVIENIEAPEVARFSPDGRRVYITSDSESFLNVVDQKTGKQIKKVPLSGFGNDIAVTPNGRQVLVCVRGLPGGLDIVDATSLERVKNIPVKDGFRNQSGLHDIVVTADGKYAAAGSPDGDGRFLAVFDLQSEQIAWEIPYDQGVQPIAIESNPDGSGRRLFLQLQHLHGFAVIDFAEHAEVARIKLPDEPTGFGQAVGTRSHGITVAPDGKTLWVNSKLANSVFVYSLPELKLLGHVPFPELKLPGKRPMGMEASWITFTPDSKTAYISLRAARSVFAIDVTTLKEVAEIPVGEVPDRISTLILP